MGVPSFNLSYVYGAFVGAGDESSLDVQYAGAVGPANTLYYWCVWRGGHAFVRVRRRFTRRTWPLEEFRVCACA